MSFVHLKERSAPTRVRLGAALISLSLILAACEDEGNPGDDNLLTGASLVVVVLVVLGIFLLVRRRRT